MVALRGAEISIPSNHIRKTGTPIWEVYQSDRDAGAWPDGLTVVYSLKVSHRSFLFLSAWCDDESLTRGLLQRVNRWKVIRKKKWKKLPGKFSAVLVIFHFLNLYFYKLWNVASTILNHLLLRQCISFRKTNFIREKQFYLRCVYSLLLHERTWRISSCDRRVTSHVHQFHACARAARESACVRMLYVKEVYVSGGVRTHTEFAPECSRRSVSIPIERGEIVGSAPSL